ncbi:MAG: NUDIX domain-containing protein [Opitutaceae bacterium]|nr:NUDIX domain-containing protein [Opitutaceae bacterium]
MMDKPNMQAAPPAPPAAPAAPAASGALAASGPAVADSAAAAVGAARMPPGPAQRDDELFDVVNERDEVIGQATRGEVHARKWLHRAVHVLARGADGRVFLQKRSMAKDTSPGRWDSSCSGHVDAGEDYAAAAVRELREELGARIAGPERLTALFMLPPSEQNGWEFVSVYGIRHDGPFELNPSEIERGEWWTPWEVTRAVAVRPGDFSSTFRMAWERFAQMAGDK